MESKFVICINNEGYEVSLEKGKVYQVIEDPKSLELQQVRVIDESGEDYLFPNDHFVSIRLPRKAQKALVA